MTKDLCFVDTLGVKYNKTLKTLPLWVCIKYTALESLVTNIALGFTSCYICHSTLISSCIPYIRQNFRGGKLSRLE